MIKEKSKKGHQQQGTNNQEPKNSPPLLSPHTSTLEEVLALRESARAQGRTVVLTNGCFDLLHRGHLDYLENSAKLGDLLIVAVNSDASVRALKGPDRPLNRADDRAHALACLRFVDATFVFPDARLDQEIRLLRPDIYTKAGDYTPDSLDPREKAALDEVGACIHIQPFTAGHSTTALIQRMATPAG